MTLAPPHFADPERRTKLAGSLDGVAEAFAACAAEEAMPGLAWGVVIDGELAGEGSLGTADLRAGRPVTPDSVFRIASMTKSITGCCVVLLRDAGALSLEDPVARHVPELADLAPATGDGGPLTIRDLLTMTGGLVTDDPWADRCLDMSEDAFGALLRTGLPFHLAPGTAFEYSNLGWAILGRLVANVSGMPLAVMARHRLFEPLGMNATTFEWTEIDATRRVQGYHRYGGECEPAPVLHDGAFGAMGGVWTTVSDFARYTAMHLAAWPPRDDPETLPLRRATLREMARRWCGGVTTDVAAGMTAGGYGYGLFSSEHRRDGIVVGHSGGLPGFGSHGEWLPAHGVGVLAFANLTYARVQPAVRRAFDALAESGALVPRRIAPSDGLRAAGEWLVGLYERWDDADAAGLAAENLPLDLTLARRHAEMDALRAQHGPCVEVGAMAASGALSGTFRMRCTDGTLEATVTLAPAGPLRVQRYELAPVPA